MSLMDKEKQPADSHLNALNTELPIKVTAIIPQKSKPIKSIVASRIPATYFTIQITTKDGTSGAMDVFAHTLISALFQVESNYLGTYEKVRGYDDLPESQKAILRFANSIRNAWEVIYRLQPKVIGLAEHQVTPAKKMYEDMQKLINNNKPTNYSTSINTCCWQCGGFIPGYSLSLQVGQGVFCNWNCWGDRLIRDGY